MYEDKINLNEVVETMQQQVLDNITSSETETEDNYALENHTHSQYALLNHRHSGYANVTHTHNDYATLDNIQTVTDDINNNINNSSDRIINELSEEIQNVNVDVNVDADITELIENLEKLKKELNEKIDSIPITKHNFDVDYPPTLKDDVTKGFNIGSKWLQETKYYTSQYECYSPSENKAIWNYINFIPSCDYIYCLGEFGSYTSSFTPFSVNNRLSLSNSNGVYNISLDFEDTTLDTYCTQAIRSGNSINLTSVNTIVFDLKTIVGSNEYDNETSFFVGLSNTSSGFNPSHITKASPIPPNHNGLYYFDVSDVSGSYYLLIGIYTHKSDSKFKCYAKIELKMIVFDNNIKWNSNYTPMITSDKTSIEDCGFYYHYYDTSNTETISKKPTFVGRDTSFIQFDASSTSDTTNNSCLYTDIINFNDVKEFYLNLYLPYDSDCSNDYVGVYFVDEKVEIKDFIKISDYEKRMLFYQHFSSSSSSTINKTIPNLYNGRGRIIIEWRCSGNLYLINNILYQFYPIYKTIIEEGSEE